MTTEQVLEALAELMRDNTASYWKAKEEDKKMFQPADVLQRLAAKMAVADPLMLCVRIMGMGFYIKNMGRMMSEVRATGLSSWTCIHSALLLLDTACGRCTNSWWLWTHKYVIMVPDQQTLTVSCLQLLATMKALHAALEAWVENCLP